MSTLPVIGADTWYEVRKLADGINLIHEPWIKLFFRCNMWHVQGRDADLLFDSGLGHFPLRASIAALRERPVICIASHSHFDHIGCHHEFDIRCIHAAEAAILADPRNDRTMTAAAMIMGMLPMALGGSTNAPLGRAVIGGLMFATVYTLFFVPCMYAIMYYARSVPEDKESVPQHGKSSSTWKAFRRQGKRSRRQGNRSSIRKFLGQSRPCP